MRAMTSSTLSASTWAVVILVLVLPARCGWASWSHLDLVRLAMHSSVKDFADLAAFVDGYIGHAAAADY